MAKSSLAAIILGIFLVFRAEAAMVSFMVIETGLPQDAAKPQYSHLWESALLDVFYEAGHIVCNAPIMRIQLLDAGKVPDAAMAELEQAGEGGADFFILAILDYKTGDASMPPNAVSLKLFSIDPFNQLYEQNVAGKNFRTSKELFDNLKKIAGGLVSRLNG